MRDDEVKSVVMTDRRIMDLGVRMFQNHGNKEHRNFYISQKLRNLGGCCCSVRRNLLIL